MPASSNLTIPINGLSDQVRGFCTTRQGGTSLSPYQSLNLGSHVGDDPQAVKANRALLSAMLPKSPVWLNQVHGITVYNADQTHQVDAQNPVPTADAAVTTQLEHPLAILTADCLPIVMTNLSGTVLGVVHAGWRGLAQGILEATLQAMKQLSPTMQNWSAWVGPGIGAQAFQVGQDVYDTFVEHSKANVVFFTPDPHHADKWFADLAGLAGHRLSLLGAQSIYQSQCCTVGDAQRFFSYRRDGQTGRMATLAWLTQS
jgi:YfiH family protein